MKKLRRIIALILTLTIMSSVAAVGSTNVFAADIDSVTDSVGDDELDFDFSRSLSDFKIDESILNEFKKGKVTLNEETLLEIQKYTRGRNTPIGELFYWGGNLAQAYSIIMAVLEMTGVVESDHAAIMRRFNDIENKLKEIQGTLDNHTKSLLRIEQDLYKKDEQRIITNFQNHFSDMKSALDKLQGFYYNARNDYATEVAIVGEPLPQTMIDNHIQPKKWFDIDNASPKEIAEYSDKLYDIIVEGCNKKNTHFVGYFEERQRFLDNYEKVAEALIAPVEENPLFAFDRYCKLIYNFDSQAYLPRVAFRENIFVKLSESIAMIHMMYQSYNKCNDKNFNTYTGVFKKAAEVLQKYQPAGKKPEEIAAYERLVVDPNEKYDGEYISEIKLAGREAKYEEAKKGLINQGYNLIDFDLNKGAHGFYIYMGYKTTKNYADAIKDVIILNGYRPDEFVYNGRTYTECKFENFNGDLNQGAHGDFLYMYTTKDEMPDKTAIQSLKLNVSDEEYYNSEYYRYVNMMNKNGFASFCADLNEGTRFHEDITLSKRLAQKPELLLDQDPEYYPYCYTLNSRVSLKDLRGPLSLREAYCFADKGSIICPDDPEKSRSWTLEEEELFRIRMNKGTLQKELLSAGIAVDYNEGIGVDSSLLTTCDRKQNTTGCFLNDSNSPVKIKTGDASNNGFAFVNQKDGMKYSPFILSKDIVYNLESLKDKLPEGMDTSEFTSIFGISFPKKLDSKEKAYGFISSDNAGSSNPAILVQHDSSDYSDYADVYKVGDVNRDGVVDITDVTLIQLHLAELKTLEGKYMKAAMINNGELSINDATEIQKYLAQYSDVNPFVDTYSI